MVHQDWGSRQYLVLLLPVATTSPAMGDAMQRQQVVVLSLHHVSLHRKAILGDEARLGEKERQELAYT